MNLKENLLSVLSGNEVDITPVVSVTQLGVVEAMEKTDAFWPEAHKDPEKMANLGSSLYELAGLECARMPFCLTVEAEAMGVKVDLGGKDKPPQVLNSPFSSADDIAIPDDYLDSGRIPTVIEAIEILKEKYDDLPIIVGITGPVTLTGHLIGVENLVRLLKTDPDEIEDAVENSLDACMDYIEAISEVGPDVICVAEPTASPELIDPLQFKSIAKPRLEDLAGFINEKNVLHICGSTQDIIHDMASIGYDGISIEEKVDITKAKEDLGKGAVNLKAGGKCLPKGGVNPSSKIIGNISTSQTLFTGSADDIKSDVKNALDAGVDVLAPSCGLAPLSSIDNIKAMIEARNEYFNI
ncbi:Methylcobamide:CoM methyltransferase MtaA [Candidatus Methanobinarius endosymbioticus]|uniref:Methylcobamide:CoM methyltransferase MtaA n=1 Tax=Candidatus Methanobinarius endosymbioticus TaxID=2006182 RepID=A0A366M982_9EURY|nr:Methylcobamide:CoM methyltransferase MtaA [Candidatus Methanobinarius endosymbioticus]